MLHDLAGAGRARAAHRRSVAHARRARATGTDEPPPAGSPHATVPLPSHHRQGETMTKLATPRRRSLAVPVTLVSALAAASLVVVTLNHDFGGTSPSAPHATNHSPDTTTIKA